MKKKNSFLKSYRKLRVLVTGTTGFKGAWLAFWLNSLGARVTGLALKPEKDSILFKSLNLISKIDQHFIDINNFTKVNQLIKKTKPDIVFHLAAQSIVSNSFSLPLETFKTNIMGSANVLEAYRVNRVPYLVYISSDKCYLNLNKEKNFKESDSLGGLDNYSSSKASAEMIFSSYFNNYFKKQKFLTVASARAGNVIGGGDMKKNRIIPDIVKALNDKKKILLLRDPKATRPWQHVLECINGYLLLGHNLLNKNLNINTIPNWNFGPKNTNCSSVENISRTFIKSWGKNKLKFNKSKTRKFYESKYLSLNINKAKKELNWAPRLNLEDTINLTVSWYKNFFNGNKNMELYTKKQIDYFLDNHS